jgi:hypothetical protein
MSDIQPYYIIIYAELLEDILVRIYVPEASMWQIPCLYSCNDQALRHLTKGSTKRYSVPNRHTGRRIAYILVIIVPCIPIPLIK